MTRIRGSRERTNISCGFGFLLLNVSFFFLSSLGQGTNNRNCLLPKLNKTVGPNEWRPWSGYGNNVANPEWGSAGRPQFNYEYDSYFQDGWQQPVMKDLPTPREISNKLFSRERNKMDQRTLTLLHTFFGHFASVDVSISPPCDYYGTSPPLGCTSSAEVMPIAIPRCDLFKDPSCSGDKVQNFTRVVAAGLYGPGIPRKPINLATSLIDLSAVYGVRPEDLNGLLNDDGSFKEQWINSNTTTFDRAMPNIMWFKRFAYLGMNLSPSMFLFAELFTREHNRLVHKFKNEGISNGTILFQLARKWNIAFAQKIITREYIAALIGRPLTPYKGYDCTVQMDVDKSLSSLVWKYGHLSFSSSLFRLNEYLEEDKPSLLTRDTIFTPRKYLNLIYNQSSGHPIGSDGFELLFRGLAKSLKLNVEPKCIDDLRNFVFHSPAVGDDLISSDIMRARELGLPPYNVLREVYDLEPVKNFSDITSDVALQQILIELYGADVNKIDAYVGLWSEDHLPDASVGPLAQEMMYENLEILRNGDRFWYENPDMFTDLERTEIYNTWLTDLLERNFNLPDFRDSFGSNPFFSQSRQLSNNTKNSVLFPYSGTYANQLDLSNAYRMSWTFNADSRTIDIMIQAATTGWVGVGFSPLPGTMKGADIVMCRILNGEMDVWDTFALDVGSPIQDINLNGTDDLFNQRVEVTNGVITCRFSRRVDITDMSNDKPIGDGLTEVIFAFNVQTSEFYYHGPTRSANAYLQLQKQSDSLRTLESRSDGLAIALWVLLGLQIFIVLIVLLLIQFMEEYFKLYSVLFCKLICLGIIVSDVGSILVLMDPPTDAYCALWLWLTGIGFHLVFSCVFLKMWRIWQIVSRAEGSKLTVKSSRLTNNAILQMVSVLVLLECVFFAVWQGVDPLEPTVRDSFRSETRYHLQCHSHWGWWVGFLVEKGLFLLVGVYLAFRARDSLSSITQAKSVSIVIYSLFIILCICIPLGFILTDIPDARLLIIVLPVILSYTTVVIMLFGAIIMKIITRKPASTYDGTVQGTTHHKDVWSVRSREETIT